VSGEFTTVLEHSDSVVNSEAYKAGYAINHFGRGVLDLINSVGYGGDAPPGFAAMGPLAGMAKSASTIDTAAVRFSQDSVKASFRNGSSLNEAAEALRAGGAEAGAKFPPIRLVEHEGKLFTLDNRRLLVFSQADQKVPFRMATEAEIEREFINKFTTTPAQGWGQFITVRP